MKVSRRGFMKGMGAMSGLAGIDGMLAQCAFAAEQAKAAAALPPPGVMTVKSTCVQCVNFCGIEAKVDNGVIQAIYPDKKKAEFYNWGICPKGATGLFNTYNPYRLKKPLKRTNPNKGMNEDPKWVEISWEEAFQMLTDKLAKVKADNPAKLVWHHGHGKYTIGDQFPKAFVAAFGTPNLVHRTTTCEAARHVADENTWGGHGHLPDLEYTNLYLSFGSNPFEGEQWSRWLDHAIMDGKERGMKMIVIEPRFSQAAAVADEWIPMRPGKDAVFILALCKQLIDNKTIDTDFLLTYTNSPQLVGEDGRLLKNGEGKPQVMDASGSVKTYDDPAAKAQLTGNFTVDGKAYRTAFQALIDNIKDMTPDYAEEVCGVPAARVVSLAKEIATAARIGSTLTIDGTPVRYRPVAAYTFRGLAAKEFGVQNSRSALILNMLIGSMDAAGGLLLEHAMGHPEYVEPSKCEYPPKRVDLAKSVYYPHATHEVCQQVQYTVNDPKAYGLGYQPEVQIFFATNRPFSTSDAIKQQDGMKKTWNCVIDIVLTETTQFADLVLPDKTYLESWHFSPTRSTPGTKHSAIRQPMANPYNIPHDAMSILWELNKRLGLRDAYAAELNKKWGLKKVTFQPGRDYTPKEMVEVIWRDKTGKDFDYAMLNGFVGKKVDVEDRYLHSIEKGCKGPGKQRIKLYADHLVDSYANVVKTVKANDIKNIDLEQYRVAYLPLPSKEHAFPTPHREAKDFPLYLITHKRMYRNQSGYMAENIMLNIAIGADAAENYIAVNPTTAKALGLKDGAMAVIETRVGKAKGKVKLTEGIRPDTIAVSYHYGQWSLLMPDYAKKGIWINQALELHPDRIAGMNSFNDTKCKLTKA
jgi:anaerobic selenocysteine-containing dehydrogenase